MPVNSKQKGKRGELEACKKLSLKGFSASRSQQFRGSIDSADIIVPRFEKLGLFPEIKRCQQITMQKWMKQCDVDINSHDGHDSPYPFRPMPVVISRRNDEEWFATMKLDDYLDFISIHTKE